MKSAALLDAMSGSGAEWWAAHYAAVADIEAGRDAIALTVGQVDLPAPACLLAKASDQVLAGRREYSAACGESPVREAIARKYAYRSGRAIGREHVIFAPGAQGCLALMSQCLADPGDDILIPEPRYITYGGISAAARLNIVPVPLRPEKNFHLDPDDLEKAISPRSKILILNSPHNPTGATLSAAELAAIGEVAATHGLWILSDEVYEDFIFLGRFASPFDDPALADRTISVGSLSKSHAVPGWRCGWAVGPPDLMAQAMRLFETVIFSTPPFLQDATAYALSRDFPECRLARRTVAERARNLSESISRAPGVKCPQPEGGIFLFLDIRETHLLSGEFARLLYETEKVSVMPGEAFGQAGAGHVRISIAGTDRNVQEGCRKLVRFAHGLAKADVALPARISAAAAHS